MNPLAQVWTATALALQSLPQRAGAAIVTVIGVAAVVAVMISILAISAGVRRFVDVNDQPERAVVLSATSPSELAGAFTPAQVAIVEAAPGVKRMPDGRPMVQPLAAQVVEVIRRKDGVPTQLFLRGTGRIGDAMNKRSLHIVAGRIYGTGVRELVVGQAAHDMYQALDVGDEITIHDAPWKIVGVYADQGGLDENSLAGDVETVRAAFESPTYQSIGALLKSPADFDRFRDALMSNPQMNVQVKRLGQFYRDQMRQLRALFDFVGIFVGGVMAIGAVCGALTTLYAAVDARRREIATLRAVGFGAGAVVVSVIIEALALAILGALIGLAIAAVGFNGHGIDTAGVAFKATVTPQLALVGVAVALLIGLVGGLFPAIRAARLPVAEALRAT